MPPGSVQAGRAAEVPEPLAQAENLKLEAVSAATAVVAEYPETAISYALLGSAHFNVGRSREAAQDLQRCLELDPRQVEAYEILARIACEKGELEEAVRRCEEGLKQGPGFPELLRRLGRARLDLGDSAEAVRAFEQAVRLAPQDSETHYLLGQACLQAGHPDRARHSFERAIALTPEHTQAYFGLFTACSRLRLTEEAGRYRQRFLELEAADRRTLTDRTTQEDTLSGLPMVRQTVARTLFGAGQIHQFHQRPEKAAPLFLRAAFLAPDNAAARTALEALYLKQQQPEAALEAFEKLAADQPENALNHLFLGRLHNRLGRFSDAAQAYRKLQELAPDRPEGYQTLAELYLRTDREPVAARAAAQKLVELQPTAPNYYLLGFACVKNNDRSGAIAAMEQAVALSPDNPGFREFLQRLKSAP
ncbi:MAG: tetratricopeptide repeat protein [Verrucomicrobiales bacterium]|nr:tetratricopeptide repeat protein [Verrucomicrobiales bacterium]